MQARLGLQKLEVAGDSKDGKTRWVRIHVPVDEGLRFKLGTITIAGNTAVRTEAIRKMFKAKEGEWLDWKKMGKSLEKVQDAYGSAGYFHFTADPVVDFPGQDKDTLKPIDPAKYKPIANVTLNLIEGKQFFVNRITFVGNTTTHDTVVRREIQLFEGGVFNVERAEVERPPAQSARLLQAARERRGRQDRRNAGHGRQGRRQAEVRGAEPQPDHVRRRRLADRRVLRSAVVFDVELPRPRRIARRAAPEGLAGPQLRGLVHRAVPVRPALERGRRRCSRGRSSTPASTRSTRSAAR